MSFQMQRIESSTTNTARTGVPLKRERGQEHRRRDGNRPRDLQQELDQARADSTLATLISDVSARAVEASTSSKRCLAGRADVVHVTIAAAILKPNWKYRLKKRIEVAGIHCRWDQKRST